MLDPNDLLTPGELATRLKVRKSWVFEKTRRRAQDPLPTISRRSLSEIPLAGRGGLADQTFQQGEMNDGNDAARLHLSER